MMMLEVMCNSAKYIVYSHCAAFYCKSRHRLHRPTSAHILELHWTKLDVCPDSCSFEVAAYIVCISTAYMIVNLNGIVAEVMHNVG